MTSRIRGTRGTVPLSLRQLSGRWYRMRFFEYGPWISTDTRNLEVRWGPERLVSLRTPERDCDVLLPLLEDRADGRTDLPWATWLTPQDARAALRTLRASRHPNSRAPAAR
ncbi:hypothetical protein [Streptomyces sp. NPDC047108]|uniref:hypothetical protein n=1 Tax=Streptomyces sp. NPDC047108 TaxID=3155025 RepID=UPI0033ED61BE